MWWENAPTGKGAEMTRPRRSKAGKDEPRTLRIEEQQPTSAAHAEGHRHLGPAPEVPCPRHRTAGKPVHDQPWIPKSGLVGRSRRSARRG